MLSVEWFFQHQLCHFVQENAQRDFQLSFIQTSLPSLLGEKCCCALREYHKIAGRAVDTCEEEASITLSRIRQADCELIKRLIYSDGKNHKFCEILKSKTVSVRSARQIRQIFEICHQFHLRLKYHVFEFLKKQCRNLMKNLRRASIIPVTNEWCRVWTKKERKR